MFSPTTKSRVLHLRTLTERMLATAQNEDLEGLAQALAERGALVESLSADLLDADLLDADLLEMELLDNEGLSLNGAGFLGEWQSSIQATFQNGEKALTALTMMKQRLQAEHGRLAQLRETFPQTLPDRNPNGEITIPGPGAQVQAWREDQVRLDIRV